MKGLDLAQMVLETKAGLEAGVVGAGHRFAAKRLDAQRSTAGWVGEQMGGLAYLGHIRDLAKRVDADWPGVQARPWARHTYSAVLKQRPACKYSYYGPGLAVAPYHADIPWRCACAVLGP